MYRLGLTDNPYLNRHNRLRCREHRKVGVHPINRDREQLGEYHHLFQQIKHDEKKFYQYTRMKKRTIDIILEAVSPHLQKQTTNFRKPISPEERLVITLR